MTDLDQALENCLDEMTSGASTLDEWLLRYPEHAPQLKPLLLTAARLELGPTIKPSAAFKARTRAKLTLHMQANPRKHTSPVFAFQRLAASLAVIVFATVITGTAYAQGTLPGDSFYTWKLASEHVWRAVSLNPVNTDIAIANRRINEMNAVADDPLLKAQALAGYQEVVTRLESELDAETLNNILPIIVSPETPEQSISTPTINGVATPQVESTSTPLPSLPPIISTEIPTLIPTIEIPSLIP